MGQVSSPWEIKLRYNVVPEKELDQLRDDYALPPSPKAGAGATLLAFAKGQASMSDVVGKAKGAKLLQMMKDSDADAPPSPTRATGNENVQRLLGLSPVQTKDVINGKQKNGSTSNWPHIDEAKLWSRGEGAHDQWDGGSRGGRGSHAWSTWESAGPWPHHGSGKWMAQSHYDMYGW